MHAPSPAADERTSGLHRARRVLGRARVVLALGALYALSQATILRIVEPLGREDVLRLQTALTPEAFLAVERRWRDAGVLDAYWRHFLFDFPHPLWYGLFLASCIALGLRLCRSPASWDRLLCLPGVAAVCDLVENAIHVLFLRVPGAIAQPWVAISGTFTHLKWGLALGSVLVALGLLARGGAEALRSASRTGP